MVSKNPLWKISYSSRRFCANYSDSLRAKSDIWKSEHKLDHPSQWIGSISSLCWSIGGGRLSRDLESPKYWQPAMQRQLYHDGLMLLPMAGEWPKTNIKIVYISHQPNVKQISHIAPHSRGRRYRHHQNSYTKADDVCAICLVGRQARKKQAATKTAHARTVEQ